MPPASSAKIIWIASYPKSGNTWMRMLLGNYLYGTPGTPMGLNEIGAHIPSDRDEPLYRGYCLRQNLDFKNVAKSMKHRDAMYRELLASRGNMFIKAHSCHHRQEDMPYYDPAITHGIIFIVRDPRDVLLSFAHHTKRDIDEAWRMMQADNFTATQNGMIEFLGSWGQHTTSFLEAKGPKMVLRYEDLVGDAGAVLRQVLGVFGQQVDPARVDEAVRFSSFDSLKQQEGHSGFVENPNADQSFFRSGTARQWQDSLRSDLAEAVARRYAAVMARLGYE